MKCLIGLLIFSFGKTSLAESQWRLVHLNKDVHGRTLNISFYDDHMGFDLFNNSIFLRTTDIGENWERISLPGNMELTDIHFVNEDLFLLSARDSYADDNTGISNIRHLLEFNEKDAINLRYFNQYYLEILVDYYKRLQK